MLTRPGANSGIYFHTRFQQTDWPSKGFEVQVNNTHRGEGDYRERKKTGSLYGVRDVYKQLVPDGEWFQMHIAVRGKQVQIRVNGALLVDYVEPLSPAREGGEGAARVLDRGTFALQCHDPGSKVYFRNLLVKPLADDAAAEGVTPPEADAVYRQILRLNAENYPMVDYHVHLKGGLTIEQALANSRRTGIAYGIAVNCGLGFPIASDAGVREFLATMRGQPVFLALQGEGREWVKLVSKEAVAKFDYVFTDAMTFTDDRGKRMRLWIKRGGGRDSRPRRSWKRMSAGSWACRTRTNRHLRQPHLPARNDRLQLRRTLDTFPHAESDRCGGGQRRGDRNQRALPPAQPRLHQTGPEGRRQVLFRHQ